MYAILFTGPPHCGKDSVAGSLLDRLALTNNVMVMHPAAVVRHLGMSMLGVDPANNQFYEQLKDLPHSTFGGKTLRRFMIDLLEDYLRPIYGTDILPKIVMNHTNSETGVLILPSIGFQEEVDFYAKRLGEDNVLVVHMSRPGCTFAGDSRGYPTGKHVYVLINDHTIEWARDQLLDCMTIMGWDIR